ncbi:MAG: cytochrome c [Bacteroidetes bacterium]|nr:cytochrome c [Bacteroidota bacterium]
MKIKHGIITLSVVTVFVIVAASCGNFGSNKTSGDETALKDTVITGQELYRENCAGCHRVDRAGTPPKFPSLVNIKDSMNKEQVYGKIKNGKVLMHSFANLPDNEAYTIASYLLNETDQTTTVSSSSLVELGKNMVRSNCLSCHHLTIHDSVPASAKILCPLIVPSALVGEVKQPSQEQFYLILKTGPCYMPSFDFLNAQDKLAIWTYLNSLRTKAKAN